jgi:hypothetical protein
MFFTDYILFVDNAPPGATRPIHLFVQPLTEPTRRLRPHQAFHRGKPGFNFFMVLGDPFVSRLVVADDTLNGVTAAFSFSDTGKLRRVWQNNRYQLSASPAIVADRDQLYINDYRDGHDHPNGQNGHDHLVLLRLSTGEELAYVHLSAKEPTVGGIVPGMHDDVYLISSEALATRASPGEVKGLISRIYIEPEPF